MSHFIHTFAFIKPWHLCLLAFVLFLPAIFSPFYSDDFFHLLLLREAFGVDDGLNIARNMPGSIWGLFSFVDTSAAHTGQLKQFSLLPWWADDDFSFRFWRPVSELSHAVDYWLFAEQAWFAHLHNVALFLLITLLSYRLLHLLLLHSSLAEHERALLLGLALFIFVVDGQHVATVSWVANRNALLAAVFVLSSSILCLSDRVVLKLFAVLVLWPLGLLSSEAALGGLGLVCIALSVYRGGLRQKFIGLLPLFVITLFWALAHKGLGYGVKGSGFSYIDPLQSPITFIIQLIEYLPVYLFANISASPAGAYWTIGNVLGVFKVSYWALAFTVCVAFVCVIMRLGRNDKIIQCAVAGFILAVIPASLSSVQDRLAVFISFFTAVLFARIIQLGLVRLWQVGGAKGLRTLLVFFIFLQLVINPVHLLVGGLWMRYEAQAINHTIQAFDESQSIDSKKLIMLGVPLGYHVMFVGVRTFYDKPLPDSIFYVGNDYGNYLLEIMNEQELIVARKPGFAMAHEEYFRSISDAPFVQNQRFSQAAVNAEIIGINAQGYPNTLSLMLDESIYGDVQIWRWVDGDFEYLPQHEITIGRRFRW